MILSIVIHITGMHVQLQVARLTLHEIFFGLPAEEQMTYIAHSRSLREDRSLRTVSCVCVGWGGGGCRLV